MPQNLCEFCLLSRLNLVGNIRTIFSIQRPTNVRPSLNLNKELSGKKTAADGIQGLAKDTAITARSPAKFENDLLSLKVLGNI